MDDQRVRGIPLEILRLIDKGASGGLTGEEARSLASYAALNATRIDPEMASYIDTLVASAPPPSTGFADPLLEYANPGNTPGLTIGGPSVADQINTPRQSVTTAGMRGEMEANVPQTNLGNLAAGAAMGAGGWLRDRFTAPGTAAATAPTAPYSPVDADAGVSGAGAMTFEGLAPAGGVRSIGTADPISQLDPSAPDRGGRRDRSRERGGTNWAQQLGTETGTISSDRIAPDSAFDDIDFNMMGDVLNNPDVAARLYAESRGGGETYAAGIEPYLAAGTGLAQLGVFDKKNKSLDLLGRPQSAATSLGQAEDWLNQMDAMGAQPDARGIYRQMFKRARKTDTGLMDVDPNDSRPAGDIANQIAVTNGALMAGQAFMTPMQQEGLEIRLNRAAQEYMLGVAQGDPEIAGMTYPEYLRAIKAQRWLGR